MNRNDTTFDNYCTLTDRDFRDVRGDHGGLQVGGEGRRGSVHQHGADVVQQFLSSILGRLKVEQGRVIVDEVSVNRAVEECLIVEDV